MAYDEVLNFNAYNISDRETWSTLSPGILDSNILYDSYEGVRMVEKSIYSYISLSGKYLFLNNYHKVYVFDISEDSESMSNNKLATLDILGKNYHNPTEISESPDN